MKYFTFTTLLVLHGMIFLLRRDEMKTYIDQSIVQLTQQDKDNLKKMGIDLHSEMSDEIEIVVSSNGKILNSIACYPNVKFVQLTSAGYDFINIDNLLSKGIIIANARGVYSQAIAEFVVARLLQVNQELRLLDNNQNKTNWNRQIQLQTLLNQKIGILGTGSIAQEMAKLLKVFNCHLVGFNTKGRDVFDFDECYPLEEFDSMSPQFDVVIVTLPLNEQTKGYMDKERLLNLKADCIFVNIARGPIVKEDELIEVLDHHLKAAILDVFDKEPLESESLLWQHPKVYLSPHISFKNETSKLNLRELTLRNIKNYLNSVEIENQIKS